MHLADGIVSEPALLAGLNLVGAGSLGVALRHTVDEDGPHLGWTGTLAAFVFAAQMINLPLVPGASAHVIGGSLLALLVGPARAVVALSAVIVAQAVLMADGGILVLGANILNIAVLPVLAVMFTRRLLARSKHALTGCAIAGTTLGNMLGASSLAATLVLGADAPVGMTFGWLVGVQSLAGFAEGILAALALRALTKREPRLLHSPVRPSLAPPGLKVGLAWATIAVGMALLLAPLASSAPDALERVLVNLGATAR